jgi:hypothetical protein
VYQYGKAINDTLMERFGAYLARLDKWGEHRFSGKSVSRLKTWSC